MDDAPHVPSPSLLPSFASPSAANASITPLTESESESDSWVDEFILINKDLYARNDVDEPLEPLSAYALELLRALSGQQEDTAYRISNYSKTQDWSMA